MKTTGKKLAEILFGNCDLEGGLPVRAGITFPQIDGSDKVFRWPGNEGLIITLIKKIEALEERIADVSRENSVTSSMVSTHLLKSELNKKK